MSVEARRDVATRHRDNGEARAMTDAGATVVGLPPDQDAGSRVGSVMTVCGPIPSSQLGITMTHEHLMVDLSVWFTAPEETSRREDLDRPIELGLLNELRRRPFSTTRANFNRDEELTIRELAFYHRAGG